jgi:hypothetical protein
MRWRIFRLYRELRTLEKNLESRGAGQGLRDLHEWLDRLEEKASSLHVPLFYVNQLYTLRMHIRVVRERLKGREEAPSAD